MDTDMLRDESTAPADIPGLVAQARAAYQQNRIKECLALTKAALLVDPGNTAALEIQAAVRFDMQRDLSDARALLEESRNKPETQKYRKAAEIILLKALYLDPDSEGAKTLLSSIRLVPEAPTSSSPAHPSAAVFASPAAPARPVVFAPPSVYVPRPAVPAQPVPPAPPVAKEPPPVPLAPPVVFAPTVLHEPPPVMPVMPVMPAMVDEPFVPSTPAVVAQQVIHEQPEEYETLYTPTEVSTPPASRAETIMSAPLQESDGRDPIPFTVGTSYIEKPGYMNNSGNKKSLSSFVVPIVIVAIVVVAGGMLLIREKLGINAAASTSAQNTAKFPGRNSANTNSYSLPSATTTSASNASGSADTGLPKTNLAAMNVPLLPVAPVPPVVPVANNKPPVAATAGTGSLAVSSAIAADIYLGDRHVGSTPATLQLPAGNQTVEYRHGDLISVMTHVIRNKETTTALVTFDVVVQLNARPWATVSVEGSPRLQLGQTPLSDVRLPIGSVLVFENPNFPSKSHKIVPDDKAIQMAFP